MYKLKNIPHSVEYTVEEHDLAQLLNSKNYDTWTCPCPTNEFPRGTSTKRKQLKDKLKEQLLILQNNHCAYCGVNFHLTTNSKIHRDHVLPKNTDRYRKFTFESKNIVLSCDICNGLDTKKDNDYATNYNDNYELINTSIVHPHLDNIEEHVFLDNTFEAVVVNNSAKGVETIREFKLNSERNLVSRGAFIILNQEPINDDDHALLKSISNKFRSTS
ncbi:HNH endonuclease family protein [Aeromonas caviae]|uniref:hypothetical protein n=1 Tax=Aeromonas caviae TaxID=648 RepID=UPI002B4A0BC3|nr:hypothetical protein [Aeromonas caviae]